MFHPLHKLMLLHIMQQVLSYQILLITVYLCDSEVPSQGSCISQMYSDHQDLISPLLCHLPEN